MLRFWPQTECPMRFRVLVAVSGILVSCVAVAMAILVLAKTRSRAAHVQSLPTAESFSVAPPPANKVAALRTALGALLEMPSTVTLTNLLSLNGQRVGTIEKIGNSMWGINAIVEFANADGERIAVPARIVGQLPPRVTDPAMTPRMDAVYIFDRDGNLRNRVGGGVAPDGVNGDAAMLTSLGLSDGLFVLVMRFEGFLGYEQVSEVFTLKPSVARALRVYHFANDPAITGKASDVEQSHGAGFGFLGQRDRARLPMYATGTGADGKPHSNWIIWDQEGSCFRGASKLATDGQPVFQVDVDASRAFVPSDVAEDQR